MRWFVFFIGSLSWELAWASTLCHWQDPVGMRWLVGQGGECRFPFRACSDACPSWCLNDYMYLRYSMPKPIVLGDCDCVHFDRNRLVPLPKAVPRPLLDEVVPPWEEKLADLNLETKPGNGNGDLHALKNSIGTQWSASSTPAPAATTVVGSTDPGTTVPSSSTAGNSQLLYLLQQSLSKNTPVGGNSNSLLLPFDLPLQSTPTPPPIQSKAKYEME